MLIKIGDVEFELNNLLVQKLDLMCDRVTKPHPKLDSCIENSGMEGEGKTNMSVIEAGYIKQKTSMPINLFFRTETCLRYAQRTEKQILILDEPVFDLLSTDFATAEAKNFLRLTSTMRKKRHFLIINFAKFWKFPEHLVVDRALGMVHLYSNQGTDMGKFYYIKKKNLEKLWNGYKKNNKRLFGKLKSFRGRVPYVMEDVFKYLDIRVENIEHGTIEDYEHEKDKAIMQIGDKTKKLDKNLIKLKTLQYKLSKLTGLNGITQKQLAKTLGTSPKTIQTWAFIDLNDPNSLGKSYFEGEEDADSINNRSESEKKDQPTEEIDQNDPDNTSLDPENDDFDPEDDET